MAKNVYRITGLVRRYTRKEKSHLRGKICRYNDKHAKYKDVSETLGYGLKIAKMPSIVVMTKSGCVRSRKHSPPT